MLKVEFQNLRYHRVLKQAVDMPLEQLKKDFEYSFVISYGEFLDHEYEIVSKNACLIPLISDSEQLLSRFSPGNRNQIRKFDRVDGFTFQTGIGDIDDYYSFYQSCERERRWHPMPLPELTESKTFSVRSNGKLITGMACYGDDDYFRVSRIYSNRRSGVGEILSNQQYAIASKKIVFEIAKYAQLSGYKFVDLGGVDLNDPGKSGLAEFKMSFRPEVVPVKIGRYYKAGVKEKLKDLLSIGIDIT